MKRSAIRVSLARGGTVPGFRFASSGLRNFLGVVPRDQELAAAAPNHSPNFYVDEKALVTGVRALSMVTVSYLAAANAD